VKIDLEPDQFEIVSTVATLVKFSTLRSDAPIEEARSRGMYLAIMSDMKRVKFSLNLSLVLLGILIMSIDCAFAEAPVAASARAVHQFVEAKAPVSESPAKPASAMEEAVVSSAENPIGGKIASSAIESPLVGSSPVTPPVTPMYLNSYPNISANMLPDEAQSVANKTDAMTFSQTIKMLSLLLPGMTTPEYSSQDIKYNTVDGIKGTSEKGLSGFRYADILRAVSGYNCNEKSKSLVICSVCNAFYEANGQPDKGIQAVAQVVLTRAYSTAYKPNVCELVYDKSAQGIAQFSWTVDNKNHTLPNGGPALESIVKNVIIGLESGPNGKSNYLNPEILNKLPSWYLSSMCNSSKERIAQHVFCNIDGKNDRTLTEFQQANNMNGDEIKQLELADQGAGATH
jgi:hypothetical protein